MPRLLSSTVTHPELVMFNFVGNPAIFGVLNEKQVHYEDIELIQTAEAYDESEASLLQALSCNKCKLTGSLLFICLFEP